MNNSRVWYNLPYAKPPVGNLRYAPPKPAMKYDVQPYDATIDQINNRADCMQGFPGSSLQSEDCLYVDVYAPSVPSKDKKGYPVMVWIHGGAYVIGSKNEYSGIIFAQNGVINVIINYRLGILGFMRISDKVPGNYGFLDQQLALKWVKANARAFGGNPSLVTIEGQSAGAASVQLHMTSPQSKGLFHRAVIHSPYTSGYYPVKEDAVVTSTVVSTIMGCDLYDKNCLRSIPAVYIPYVSYMVYSQCMNNSISHYAYDIDKGYQFCGMAPEVLTVAHPQQPYEALLQGRINTVPIIMGHVWNEGLTDSNGAYDLLRTLGPYIYSNDLISLTQVIYQLFLNQIVDHKSYAGNSSAFVELLSERAQSIYDTYPVAVDEGMSKSYPFGYNGYTKDGPLDANYAYRILYHDKYYYCPSRQVVRRYLERNHKDNAPVYLYRYKQVSYLNKLYYQYGYGSDPVTAVNNDFWSQNLYSSHSDDVNLIFNQSWIYMDDNERALSFQINYALTNFYHTGDPNKGPSQKQQTFPWIKYSHQQDLYTVLIEPHTGYDAGMPCDRVPQCDFWDSTGYTFQVGEEGQHG